MHGPPPPLISHLENLLTTKVTGFQFIKGGCISLASKIETTKGDFFLKWNDAKAFPDMFEKEGTGLKRLAETKTVNVPEVIAVGEQGNDAFLLLQYLPKGYEGNEAWTTLGQQVAQMHQQTQPSFGLDHDNYMGNLPQSNSLHASWLAFFIQERLMKQVALAAKNGLLNTDIQSQFDLLYKKLPELLPDNEKPALLHGDLWTGNVLVSNHVPFLMDPAVYYGNREMDIAGSHMFNKFPTSFYQSYEEAFPLESNFTQRTNIYNLYPLLVHVNLFGEQYLWDVKVVLEGYLR